MINAYSDIIAYSGDDWEDYLTKICLIDIFKDLIPIFKNKEALTQAIRYIVWTYSKNSDADTLGGDWLKIKKRIFDKTLLPQEYHEDLVLLKNGIVIRTIQNWIDFQDENVYSTLVSLRDLMIEMRLSSNSNLKKTDLITTDFDQKFKNAGYAFELGKMIKDLESELVQNDIKLKEGVRELKRACKNINTLGVERYAV
jgi:hypothetical protein